MKNKLYLFIFLCFHALTTFTQNLITNGDFESYSSIPINWAEWYKTIGWSNVNGSYFGISASPDYIHSLGFFPGSVGAISPHGGNGQMGLITYTTSTPNYREYISAGLNSPLIVGEEYKLTFFLSGGNGQNYGVPGAKSDNFGAHFSVLPLIQDTFEVILVTPQIVIPGIVDAINFWQQYTFTFIANSPAEYITIGNFQNDSNTTVTNVAPIGAISSYNFIDDIELTIALPLEIQGDSSICLGDSTILTSLNKPLLGWADSLNPFSILSTDSTLTVSPNTTTTYFAYGSNDTASFTVFVLDHSFINLGNDTTLCQGESIVLDASTLNASYLWQDNTNNSNLNVTQQGIYWVVVTENSCISTDTVQISFNPLPSPDLGVDTLLCQGEILQLDVTTPNATYQWQNYTTNSTLTVLKEGMYWVEVTINNCSVSDSILVNFQSLPALNLGGDLSLCPKDTLVLNATTPNATYLWQDNSKDSILFVTEIGDYWVTVFSGECSATDYISIRLECEIIIEMPNVFSPNGDGINDFFVPVKNEGISTMKTVIVNRWGNIVFETDNLLINWDGQYAKDGTYFWSIEYVNIKNETTIIHGFVNLTR